MKTLRIVLFSFLAFAFAQVSNAQSKTETLKVAGECGMCKKKIETAAKAAGATDAKWSPDTKQLVVTYNSTSANAAKIQQSIAAAGYDTETIKATEEAYNKLHDCCKYERTAAAAMPAKADMSKEADCCKDGKCSADAACCKDKSCCTADGKCTHHADGANAGKQDCCKKA